MAFRIDKVSGEIKREIAAGIRQLKDPRITGLVSVVDAEATRDLKYAKIYVSVFTDDEEQKKAALQGLKSAAGYLRQELKKSMSIRQIPELQFELDDSIGYGAHINQLLKQIENGEE